MNALVLSGGANKGCYEAGAIEVVLKNGFVPDGIYGVSVGSLNALFLADRAGRAILAGKSPDWPAIGSELVQFWQQKITGPSSFIIERSWLAIGWAAIIGKFNGLLDTSPLRKLIDSEFTVQNIAACPARMTMGTVNVWSALYEDVDKTTKPLFDYAMGSAAEPVYMPGAIINGEPYFDGGLRNIAPFSKPIADGATTIIAAVCQPKNIGRSEIKIGDPIALIERSTDILTSQIINNDIDMAESINQSIKLSLAVGHQFAPGHILYGKRHVDIKVIRPAADLPISMTTFSSADVQRLIAMGQTDAQ
jgi:NTE family protein